MLSSMTNTPSSDSHWRTVGFTSFHKSLEVKSFFGTSENAVKTQIWIAISVYVLVAILKKRLDFKADLYTIFQVLSLTLFDKILLKQLLSENDSIMQDVGRYKQLSLFDNLTGQ